MAIRVIVGESPPAADEFYHGWKPDLAAKATHKDVAESQRVAQAIGGAVAKECYFNARRVIQRLADYAKASYVEGWALVALEGMAVSLEHGWIVRGGVIIDPTLPIDPANYFPGLEFVGRKGITEFLATPEGNKVRRSPYFHAFGWAGSLSPSFRAALKASREADPSYQAAFKAYERKQKRKRKSK